MAGEGTFAEQLRKLESDSAELIWQKLLEVEARVLQPPAAVSASGSTLSNGDEEGERRAYVPMRTHNGLRGEAPCTTKDLDEWRPLVARVLAEESDEARSRTEEHDGRGRQAE
jgi:hypothetical protein